METPVLPFASQVKMTPEEYLTFERASPEKHELIEGELTTMGGASDYHNRIASSLHVFLGYTLRDQDYLVYRSDLRVKNPQGRNYYYPDVVVVRGEPAFTDQVFDTLLNPVLIAEVLSPGTTGTDRTVKHEAYLNIASLQEYLLISSIEIHVSYYRKLLENRWEMTLHSNLTEELPLLSGEALVTLMEIYRKVKF